eukprot:1136902-Pelagomonas_calceolata.AAC.7
MHTHTHTHTHARTLAHAQVVNIAKEYTDQLSSAKVMELLEKQNAWPGLYFYLGSRLAMSEVKECEACVGAV